MLNSTEERSKLQILVGHSRNFIFAWNWHCKVSKLFIPIWIGLMVELHSFSYWIIPLPLPQSTCPQFYGDTWGQRVIGDTTWCRVYAGNCTSKLTWLAAAALVLHRCGPAGSRREVLGYSVNQLGINCNCQQQALDREPRNIQVL